MTASRLPQSEAETEVAPSAQFNPESVNDGDSRNILNSEHEDPPITMTPALWLTGLLAVAIGVGVGFVFSAASLFK